MGSAGRTKRSVAIILACAGILAISASTAHSITGAQKWAVVLCNFNNQTQQPSFTNYNNMFETGASTSVLDVVDFWRDNSYGKLNVTDTAVTGWHTIPETRDAWEDRDRNGKQVACGNAAAAAGFNFAGYYGFITIFPEVRGTLGAAIDADDTTITVNTAASYDFYPTPPFRIVIDDGTDTTVPPDGSSDNSENLRVTAVSGNQFTVTRAADSTTAKAHNAAASVSVPGDLFGRGQPTNFNLGGNNFNLGSAVLPSDVNVTGAAHETGHGFNYDHSRKLSTSTTDYADCYDIMSAYNTCSFAGDFGLSNLGSVNAAAGPGITGILLDEQGWLEPGRVQDLDNSACNQTTTELVALNQNGISGKFVARIPASIVINTPGNTTTTSSKYWLEYREQAGWDAGVPPGVILHLEGADQVAYWVDSATADGRLIAGEEFVNAAQKTYLAVHSLDTGTHKAQITMAGCKIDTTASYVGPTTGDYSDAVTLAGDLKVGSTPVPGKTLTLQIGTQSCTATTNASGRATCPVTLNQAPGTYTAGASFAGNAAYNAASDPDTNNFTITKEDSQLIYAGATAADYHDAFTATATLSDADDATPISGRTVSFELGSGDTCDDTTDSDGVATCSMTPTQVPGPYTLKASFGPDTYYENSSASPAFTITKEETTLTFSGPTVILAGSSGATMTATLIEDGANDDAGEPNVPAAPSPSGQTITFTLGGQSCSDATDSAGNASCEIPSVSAASLGSNTLATTFAGDAYYLGSSDSDAVIVFAFPSRGAFVLGDNTVAAATPTTAVTWWSDTWWQLNSLTGGTTPTSFKGFAGAITSLPTQSPANVCGTRFTTGGGNSPPPTSGVPPYMGVLVASSVTKKGTTINGTWGKVVVVRTDPGYAPNAGHPGTGTIVATFCP